MWPRSASGWGGPWRRGGGGVRLLAVPEDDVRHVAVSRSDVRGTRYLSSSSLVCSDANAACCCASSARIWFGDIVDTFRSGEPEPPPELAEVFADEEVKESIVHTQIKFSQNYSRDTGGGCELLYAQKNTGHQKGFGKRRNLKFFQLSLNSLRNNNFWLLGGPWHGLPRPSSHYVGPHVYSSTRIVTK